VPVSSQETVFHHVGNGVTVTFAFSCQVPTATDLAVYVNNVLITTGFTIAGIGDLTGGSITFGAPPASLATIRIERDIQLERTTDYQQNGDFLSRVVNPDFDRLWMALQQQFYGIRRALKVPKTDATPPNDLPSAADRANKLLSFDSSGQPIAVAPAAQSATALQLLLASAVGSAMVGYSADGSTRTVEQMLDVLYYGVTNVRDVRFAGGAKGDNVADDYAAIQAALNFVNQAGKGGVVFVPKGKYKCGQMLTIPWTGASVTLEGVGGLAQTANNGTSIIYGAHTQDAVINMQGAVLCQINNLVLDGGTGATFPKTGLLLGRNGAGSAGWHTSNGLGIVGRFSVAPLYNVASEGNTFRDLFIILDAGSTATKCIYLSGGDSGGLAPVTPLTGSTLLGQEFINCHIYHMGIGASVSCIYIDGSVSLGSIAFRGGYLVQANGHFVTIRSGTVDGKDTLGPITFEGVGGERPGGIGVPISGFNLIASVGAPKYLRGLDIRNCRFLMAAGYYVMQDIYVKLANAVILSQGIDVSNPALLTYRPSLLGISRFGTGTVVNGECLDCLIDVGSGFKVEGTNQATLLGAWVQTFSTGNGYGVVGYYKDLTGHVHLTGAPSGGATGTVVFNLPVGYRPATNKTFTITSNVSGIAGQGDTIATVGSNGDVTVTGGNNPCYLTSIVFPTFA
jgi:hypothetical protein